MTASRPTVQRRPADVATIMLVILSVLIAAMAVLTLVQAEAATAAANTAFAGDTRLEALDDQVAHRNLLVHVSLLRRFASGALFSACAVLAAALLLRRARSSIPPIPPSV